MNVVRAIILALVGIAAGAMVFATELGSTGVVTAQVAEFSIPVTHEGPWRWARVQTRDNVLEFMWDLSVKSGGGEYQFGFSLFKFPGTAEGTGNLDELLRAGQASLWKIGPDGGGSLVEGAMVSATADAGRVVIRLSDPASVRLLFGDRPAVAKVLTRTPDGSPESHEVSIEYRQ